MAAGGGGDRSRVGLSSAEEQISEAIWPSASGRGVRQRLDDRAARHTELARAVLDQDGECRLYARQIGLAATNIFQVAGRNGVNLATGHGLLVAEAEHVANRTHAEPERQGPMDEPDLLHIIGRIEHEATGDAPWFGEQAEALIGADGVDGDAGSLGKGRKRQGCQGGHSRSCQERRGGGYSSRGFAQPPPRRGI